MLTVSPYLITLFTLSEITCYTLLGPKLYSQSLPANNRPWSNVVPYPFRTYQPSIPLQYYGRYVGDPYFAPNIQNPDYYFSQDNYPYSSSFDDPDYYSNFLYYIPTSRRIPYYDQPVVDPIDEIQDYDEETPEDDSVPKSQRDWWLEKNVLPNEDADFTDFNLMDDLSMMEAKDTKVPKKPKTKSKEAKKKPQNKYVGIDGFGRKKDKEQIYGTFRPNPRRDEDRTWVYGVPVHSKYSEDQDVRELRSLLKEPKEENREFDNSGLANWIVGNAKRSQVKNSRVNENSSKTVPTLKSNLFPIYNEAGTDNFPIDFIPNERWSNDDNEPEEPSVFDKIKRLLALEDKVNQVGDFSSIHSFTKSHVGIKICVYSNSCLNNAIQAFVSF